MPRGEVLVAIMNSMRDWEIVQEEGWYRIPIGSADKWIRSRNMWPPQRLAFYQTKIFGREAFAVNYWAPVERVEIASRLELLPDTPLNHSKAARRYYNLRLGPLRRLPEPIVSRRYRRLVFIPTTLEKFQNAVEINDLWDESPLEDKLWALLKRAQIAAERQYTLQFDDQTYFLDFAIFCTRGNLDVEVDGDRYHHEPNRVDSDKERSNDLATRGWRVLRFTSTHINEQPVEYCLRKVKETVNQLGGLDSTTGVPPRHDPDTDEPPRQLSLFD